MVSSMVKIQKFSSPKNHSKATKKHPTPKQGPSFEYFLRSTQIEDLTLKKWSQLNFVPCIIRLKSLHKNLQTACLFIRITWTYKGRRPIKGNHKQQRKKVPPSFEKAFFECRNLFFVSRNLPLYPKIGGIKIFDYLWRLLASSYGNALKALKTFFRSIATIGQWNLVGKGNHDRNEVEQWVRANPSIDGGAH